MNFLPKCVLIWLHPPFYIRDDHFADGLFTKNGKPFSVQAQCHPFYLIAKLVCRLRFKPFWKRKKRRLKGEIGMRALRMVLTSIVILGSVGLVAAFGQGQRLNLEFDINQPYTIGDSNLTLPAGHYVLHQVLRDDLSLFALYQGDRTRPPMAEVWTTSTDYRGSSLLPHSKVIYSMNEQDGESNPVLNGWKIPGWSGWKIIAVKVNRKYLATRAQ